MSGVLVLVSECEIPHGRDFGNNHPELRRHLICDKLAKSMSISHITFKGEVPSYCDFEYINFLREGYNSALQSNDTDWVYKGALIPNHHTNHINRKVPLYKQAGYYINDHMTPIIESTWNNVLSSITLAEEAATIAMRDKRVVYALTPSPGHHATFSSGGGYCFINNGAVAAMKFLSSGYSKGAILDLDFHAGDGTQRIFYDRSDVLTVSIHADPYYEYPSFRGFADEIGSGYNINYPLYGSITYDTYNKVLIQALEQIKKFNPQFLIIAFGGDTYKNDPDASDLCKFSLELEDYKSMGEIVYSYFSTLPIIITQEGGYNMENIATVVHNFLEPFNN